jgi:hypothetical protein
MTATRYEIRVRGEVGPALREEFDRLRSRVEPVETVFFGPVADQAELQGLITRCQYAGLEIVEVRRLPD